MRTPVAMTVPAVVETGLGGTFYLLNLALHLGLYGDFSSPAEPGLALSPWDLLALLGRAILGSPRAEERRDPLWALLARLAGRSPGTPPGAGFRAPRTWRAPIAWLEPFAAAGEWQWSAAGGSLRILHPAGFPAVAVPRRGTAAVQLTGELDRLRRLAPALRDVTPVRRRQRPEPAGALARWTARLAAFGAARLRLALGMDRDAPLADLLLRRRARVLVTHTHLEVQLGLAELPLAVRFAGLDRTPGWVPAAGRTVRFEFA
jgi:hypothetical protein